MKYTTYKNEYYNDYREMIKLLWSDIKDIEINELIEAHSSNKEQIYLAIDNEKAIAFLNTSIRTDYVEGSGSSKTGYIEGIYVLEEYRHQSIANNLLSTAFSHFKEMGINEVGSDVELENKISSVFHEKVGFKEVSRNIHYLLKLK